MNSKKNKPALRSVIALGLGLALASSSLAQAQSQDFDLKQGAKLDGRTLIKTDAIGLINSSYHLAVERIISQHFSIQLSYSTSPWRSADDTWLLVNRSKNHSSRAEAPSAFRFNSFNLDLRIYTGKRGYGQGFYLSPYLHYSSYYDKNKVYSKYPYYKLSEKERGLGYGFGLGYQWYFGSKSNFLIDLNLFGFHRSPSFYTQKTAVYTGEASLFKAEDSKILGEWMLDNKHHLTDLKSYEDGRRLELEHKRQRYFFRANLRVGIRF